MTVNGVSPGARIVVEDVLKSFGSGARQVHAFPACLSVEPGEFISVLGPSGCGKSTLILMIAGLLDPTAGRITLDDEDVEGPRTDIGIMFQDNTLVPWRSVRGNIALQLELRGLNPRLHEDRIASLIRTVHLEDFEDRAPYELSGGMQQRAAFCQALVHGPRTLLLDEPLGKLDAMTREAIRHDLEILWLERRPTVVLVTHSIEKAVQLSNRVVVVTPRPGRIHSVIAIDLPWPRNLAIRCSAGFVERVAEIQEISMVTVSSSGENLTDGTLPSVQNHIRLNVSDVPDPDVGAATDQAYPITSSARASILVGGRSSFEAPA